MTTRFIQAPEFFVVTGIGTSETQITVSNFKTISGVTIDQTMIGGASDYVSMTLSPRTEREEQVLAKVNRVSGDNVILDIQRAVNPVSPYNVGGGVARAHNVNDTVVISDNPALYNKLTAKDNNETVTGSWSFPETPTIDTNPVTKGHYDDTGVKLTGAQNIAGVKTFTDSPIVPAADAPGEAINKGQFDAEAVKLTGNQTVAGTKTFSNSPIVPTAVNPTDAINKSQVEAFVAANSGDILATNLAFGTTKLDVAADVPSDPKALTATANRVAALSGGGALGIPSSTNKFVTERFLSVILNAGETINGATLPVPVWQNKTDNELYACDANDNTRYKFIGFVTSNSTNGNPITFQGSGIVSGFTGLQEGEKYYVQDAVGTIGTTPGTQHILVGIAISETQLLIQKGNLRTAGVVDLTAVTASGSSTVTLGFRPSVIQMTAFNNDSALVSIASGNWVNGILSASSVTDSHASSNQLILFASATPTSNSLNITITSVTDTGFTFTWTENGTYTATSAYINWIAVGEL